MCIDYRKINKLQPEVTKADGEKGCISLISLPKIDELYAKFKGYKVFSSLDNRSGYYHIGLTESAKPKSAFVLSSLGKYQFNRVPFGLAQAPAYFQKLINDILKGCNFAMGYQCCDTGQNDTIGKTELNPSFVLSSDETNSKNDIQLFHQLFDELRVNGDCH